MKKLMFLGVLLMTVSVVFAQQPKTGSHQKKMAKTEYVCPKCFAESTAAGKCSMDGTTMVKMGDYFCPKCLHDFGKKGGKCSMDGAKLVRMTPKYVKEHEQKM